MPAHVGEHQTYLSAVDSWLANPNTSGGVVRSALDSVLENSPRMVQGCRQRGGGFLSAYNYANIWIVCPKSTMYSNIQHPSPTILQTCLHPYGDSEISRKVIDLGTQTASCSSG